MANLSETPTWEDGVYQLEEDDLVKGGADGIDNVQARQLANRTAFLKALVANLASGTQPLARVLTALSGLSIPADKIIYSIGEDAFSTADLTAFMRTLLGNSTAAAARASLGAAASGANSDITSLAGLTTALSIAQGGTGAKTAVAARAALGAAAGGANGDITSLSGLTTALSIAQGGTGATTAIAARTALGAASPADIETAIAALVDSSPAALDTLKELSAALGNDADFAATVNAALSTRVTKSELQNAVETASVATGTSDAITASFTPLIAALTNGMRLFVRAASTNATTTPTFTPNAGTIAAKAIVKGAGAVLTAGDIAGSGYWLELQYDATLDKWVLLNPANGVSPSIRGWQVFTSSGTFTVPLGVTEVVVEVWGGGGSGAGPGSGQNGNGGGAAGGYALKRVTGLDPGGIISVTVGPSVAGQSTGNTSGTNGSTSSFGAFCSATGGEGGKVGLVTAAASHAVGGTGVGGDVNIQGGYGLSTPNSAIGGTGGNAPRGGAGGAFGIASTATSSDGRAGGLPGGGGGGADDPGSVGGAGAAGMVYVRWGF